MLAAFACEDTNGRERQTARQRAAVKTISPSPTPTPTAPPVDCMKAKCVALTFDDGPGEHTARLLDDLKAAGGRATFFMLGQNVAGNEALLKRMVQEGHEVANHSWSHPEMTELSSSAVRAEVQRTNDAIQAASGVRPTMFRPPYGATDARVGRAVAMPQILWSVDSLDWQHRSVSTNIRIGTSEPESGGIVLFHDIHPASVDAIPQVLSGLKRRGFTFVTVSQIFQGQTLKPGHQYLQAERPLPKPKPASPSGTPSGSPSGTPSSGPSGGPGRAPSGGPPSPSPSWTPSATPLAPSAPAS
ncbi:polysaccharide deacetylase family protein [Actinomadura rudentiformis]|uniref:Polysaccharide deacetylase family protein n=2 Tax=Actinomadura rudentiformis TaxID=359158 RepID=A0A6H9YBR7_9ACTN|nr:polysaccharide deacetylase family protein [Actinomadura rudentiformis]